MQLIISSLLPYLTCLAMLGISAVLWWSKLNSPWPFVIFGALTLLGTHHIGSIAVEAVNLFSASGQILEYQGQVTPESIERAQSTLMAKAIKASVFVLLVGGPLLIWLKALLSKA